MWHASAQGNRGDLPTAKRLCRLALAGVGDAKLGEWEGIQGRETIWHVQRRLTDAERQEFGVPDPVDVRGTSEERCRIDAVFAEAPHLRGRMPS